MPLVLITLLIVSIISLLVLLFRSPDTKLLIFERAIRNEVAKNREEMAGSLKDLSDSLSGQLMGLTQLNEQKLDSVRKSVEERLEQIRATVDEKLHDTLEKRLGESFKLVSDRLDLVHKGLGEMQTLATGVGDLKRVLTNVKTRGTWGEIQLGTLLDEILTLDQYAKNVATKPGSQENVEFAIKLPGRDGKIVWLPIDAKFPKEDYERLLEAQEEANPELVEELGKSLENKIKLEAKDIRDKYIDPPHTTDFGILFLPTEGLYAEVIRRPGLFSTLQREYKISITGPTTIAAFLNSLQMGFRTLAIEKRASEIWNLLGAVKAEFGKFGALLDKTHKQLAAASNTIEGAARKSRTIEKRLKDVEELPIRQEAELLGDIETIDTELEEDKLSPDSSIG